MWGSLGYHPDAWENDSIWIHMFQVSWKAPTSYSSNGKLESAESSPKNLGMMIFFGMMRSISKSSNQVGISTIWDHLQWRKKKKYAAPVSPKFDELKRINWTRIIPNLVGGWNPFEKYARQNGLIFGVKIPKILWNHHLLLTMLMVQKSHSQPPGMVLKPRK